MTIPDHRQYSCHRLQTYFLLLHKSIFFLKPNYKSRKEDLCQKFIFGPAPSFMFFSISVRTKDEIFKDCLISGIWGVGLAPQKPNNMHFSTVLSKIKSLSPDWLVVVTRRKVL